MHVEWTGKQTRESETNAYVLQARVNNGKHVSVYISEEAVQDHGIPACKVVAEGKILAGVVNGEPPKRVNVTTADFR